MATLEQNNNRSKPKKLVIDIKHREYPTTKPYIKEASKLDVKALPPFLWYVFLGRDDIFPVIIAADLDERQVDGLVVVLKWFK